jgi:hypothetical protein
MMRLWQWVAGTHTTSCRKRNSDAHKLSSSLLFINETIFNCLQVPCNSWASRRRVAAQRSGQSPRLGVFIVAVGDWVRKYVWTQNYNTLFAQKCIKWNNDSEQIKCGALSSFPNSCSYNLSYFFYVNVFENFISMTTLGETYVPYVRTVDDEYIQKVLYVNINTYSSLTCLIYN